MAVISRAIGLARLPQNLVFGIDALDPLTFLAFPAILVTVGALAALIPASAAGW